jgi:DNA-binding IclR family transcriptional regulator
MRDMCRRPAPPQIAQACGASAPHLYKVLRVLAHHKLLDELPGQHFTPNDATRELVQVWAASLAPVPAAVLKCTHETSSECTHETHEAGRTVLTVLKGKPCRLCMAFFQDNQRMPLASDCPVNALS